MPYHLFEMQETVICGLPDMDMATDKWRQDIFPVIEQSRYRDLLPRRGGGSRGGKVESIQFRNGATLKHMSGGGSDKSRAGFTSRVLVITETDGMDQPGITSRESDKITQLEARTRAYGARKRVYMECTVSTEEGRTWQEYKHGTQSRLALPCPCCQAWVSPEREHLSGWQGAASQVEARSTGSFSCPACGEFWDETQRTQANQGARLLHKDQTIEEGVIQGDAPATDTLGFRWSAVNNLFLPAGELAADEWRAGRAADEENAEREMRQFVWCLVEIDADHWKTWVHQRLSTPLGTPGAMTLFQATPQDHLAFAKHLTAETKTEEFVTGKGVVVKWERIRRQNHWFDAFYNACAAGHFCGVRLVNAGEKPARKRIDLAEMAARVRYLNETGNSQRWQEMRGRYQ